MNNSQQILTLQHLYDFSNSHLREKDPIEEQLKLFAEFLAAFPPLTKEQMSQLVSFIQKDYGLSYGAKNSLAKWISYITAYIVALYILLEITSLSFYAFEKFAVDMGRLVPISIVAWLLFVLGERLYVFPVWKRLWLVLVAHQLRQVK